MCKGRTVPSQDTVVENKQLSSPSAFKLDGKAECHGPLTPMNEEKKSRHYSDHMNPEKHIPQLFTVKQKE